MIKDVPLIGVFVNDQEAAMDFYTEKLGLTKVQDDAYGPEARWITVSPAKSKIRIVLKKAQKDYEKAMVGNSDGAPVLTLGTDDVRAAHERLRERGADDGHVVDDARQDVPAATGGVEVGALADEMAEQLLAHVVDDALADRLAEVGRGDPEGRHADDRGAGGEDR